MAFEATKREWGELYAFFRLLANGYVYAGLLLLKIGWCYEAIILYSCT